MFETQNSNAGIYKLAMATMLFAGGYFCATYRASNNDVQLSAGPNKEVLLSYKKTPARVLSLDKNVATLGTLEERLDDLLLEEPGKIRQLTRKSLIK